MHVAASPSAIRLHVVGRILAAALPQRRTSSSRLIGNPPENAVAGAVRSESSAFVEAVQRVSDFHWTPACRLSAGFPQRKAVPRC